MSVRIGLVGERADLAVEVASLAAGAGASVLSLQLADVAWAAGGSGHGAEVDLVLVDVAAARSGGSGGWGSEHVAGAPVGGGLLASGAEHADGRGVPAGEGPWGRPPPTTVVICRSGEGDQARDLASALGCSHVVELPLASPWLASQLAPQCGSAVLGVVGGVGGVGATTVAMACAVGAAADCLLVDADPDSPGLDLPLGIPEGQGVRWDQVPDTADPLDPASLRAALPSVGEVSVVTGSGLTVHACGVRGPGPGRLGGVVGVGRADFARTVIDLGRGPVHPGLVGPGDALVLVLPATLSGVVAGRRVVQSVPTSELLVLLRPTGWLPAEEVAEQLGVPVAIEVPHLRRAAELADCGDLFTGRTGRALRQLGERIWEHLG